MSDAIACRLEGVAQIIRERGATHGDALTQHQMVAGWWTDYLRSKCGLSEAVSAADVAILLSLMKAGRIACGDSEQVDHYDDITGYGAIAAAAVAGPE